MGDRCSIVFELGGKITKAQAEDLVALMGAKGLVSCEDDAEPKLDNLHEHFRAEEVNYGVIDVVTNYCISQRIPFELWNDAAGGGYSAGLDRFDGATRKTCVSDSESEPLFPLSEIIDPANLGTCWAGLIAKAKFFCNPLPEVEIVP